MVAIELVTSTDWVKEGETWSVEGAIASAVVVSDGTTIVVVPLTGTRFNIDAGHFHSLRKACSGR